MDEVTRLLILLVFAGVAVTLVAGVARWNGNESRRIKRGLKAVLQGEAHGFLPALGRGRGLGFNFTTNEVAVVWDAGAWGLLYSLDELMGVEVIVDGLVVGRAYRGEQRLALNAFDALERVSLRLVFDDMSHPDFVLDLWLPEDEGRRDELPPAQAIAEANRWLARIEALLRRPMQHPRPAAVRAPSAAVEDEPAPVSVADIPPTTPLFGFSRAADADDHAQTAADDEAPWDGEDDEGEDEIRSLRL